MRLPTKPLNPNFMWLDAPGTMRWLAGPRVGVGDACTDVKNAASAAAKEVNDLKAQKIDLDTAIINGQQNGQDTTELEHQRDLLNQQIAAATSNVAVLAGKAAIVCGAKGAAESKPQPGPQINTTCKNDGDCTSDYECFKGNCVPKCPTGWKRQDDGSCAQASVAVSSSSWGLGVLAAAVVGGIFLASKSQLKELGRGGIKNNPHRYASRTHLRAMTKAEAKRQFESYVLPAVIEQYGSNDRPAIRQAWNEWVDSLERDGRITEKQAYSWSSPYR